MSHSDRNHLSDAQHKAQRTFDQAVDCFDAPPLEFWDRYGKETVQRLSLAPGARILDVACGAGASALPAAEAVGSSGSVLGVDVAGRLLERARVKAFFRDLRNVKFLNADMNRLEFPDGSFDAVICVFGVFFAADMASLLTRLWRLVNRGGKLAITTWGPRILAPAYQVWQDEIRRRRPDLYCAFNPWDRISSPEELHDLFWAAGIPAAEVVSQSGFQPLATPDDFWTIALGSGLRWTVEQLGHEAEDVRPVRRWIETNHIDRVETNVLYAVARQS